VSADPVFPNGPLATADPLPPAEPIPPADRIPAADPLPAAEPVVLTGPVVLVHGGAGDWREGTDEALDACRQAAEAGREALIGGSALDAVLAAVRVLEDAPILNAGTGAVLTRDGTLELDACVMDGSTLTSGAVAALSAFRHPIDVAKAVLDDGRYHLLVAEGAARFATDRGFSPVDPQRMITTKQRAELARGDGTTRAGNTVGAVALDRDGRLAAATSTGGLSGTLAGRVGDSPIVGAGTYANGQAACSCTGDGEAFARACAAFWAVERVAALSHDAHRGSAHQQSRDAGDAGEEPCPDGDQPQLVVEQLLKRVQHDFHGNGGVILLDRRGGEGEGRGGGGG
jgi:L-asparaginase / beta-aspartyl-peptidase